MNDKDIIQAMKTKYPKLSWSNLSDSDIIGAARKKHPDLFTSKNYIAWWSEKKPMTLWQKAAIWVWSAAWWLWLMKWAWALSEYIGKWLYWLTLAPTQAEAEAIQAYKAWTSSFKPRITTQTMLDQPLLQKWVWEWWVWTKTRLWQIGTREMVGRQSEAAAWNIYTKTINPIMEQADKQWIKLSYKDLISKAKETIKNSNKYSESQKKTILENINKITKDYKWTTTLKNLDLEKQAVASKVPARLQTAAKIPNELKAAQSEVAKSFRQWVHNTIKNKFGVDSAKLYGDYANLKWVSKIWSKAMTQAGRKWGAWWFLSWVWEEVATPVTTTVGKIWYKLWKAAQKLPDAVWKAAKNMPKAFKTMLKTNPALIITPDLVEVAKQWQDKFKAKVMNDAKNKTGIFKGKTEAEINKILYGKNQ